MSDPFIKNKYSVLPILIEKNFEQKTGAPRDVP